MFKEEKRQHRRAPASISVDYKVGDVTGRCIATDISQNGIFLNIQPPPQIGSRIYLSFVLPGFSKLPPLKVVGKVVRVVQKGQGQVPGVGVEFDLIYAESRETIRSFVRRILGPTVVISKAKESPQKGKHYRLDYRNIQEKGPFETEATREDEEHIREFNFSRLSEIDTHKAVNWIRIGFIILITGSIGYSLYVIVRYLLR
jgi:Tfp pilus assembly protein PilZ